MADPIVIIGAGQAGATLALHLREKGFAGPITIVGAEPHPPYQRPPLSKKYLSGEWGADRLYLRDSATWRTLGVELHLGAPVRAIDAADRSLRIGTETLRWGKLALTTGAQARPLPAEFAGRDNVFELRTLGDVERLKPLFRPGARLAIIGGGFVGLEAAAVAARAGLAVSVIERAARILERAVGPATSDYFRALHTREGVRIFEGRQVAKVAGAPSIETLTLDDGSALAVDGVLVGIGVAPACALAEEAALACDNGIAVDAFGRTSTPDIWAAGDCASFPHEDRRIRLESVQNAIDQAKVVAEDMLGMGRPYAPVPWFWSDQFETKLQIAGLSQGHTRVIPRAGRAGCSHWYFKDNRLLAVEAINDAAAFMTARKLLELAVSPDPDLLRDEAFDPRRCLA